MQKNWQRFGTGIIALGILAALLLHILGQSFMLMGNVLFLIGLALLVVGAVLILIHGHLFTGWRRKKAKGATEPGPGNALDNRQKIDISHVASAKNTPIRVTPGARFCLLSGIGLVVIGIGFTLI